MRGSYGVLIVFYDWIYVYVDVDAKNRPIWNLPQWDDFLSDSKAAFRSRFIVDGGRNELQKSGGSNSRKQIVHWRVYTLNPVICLLRRFRLW